MRCKSELYQSLVSIPHVVGNFLIHLKSAGRIKMYPLEVAHHYMNHFGQRYAGRGVFKKCELWRCDDNVLAGPNFFKRCKRSSFHVRLLHQDDGLRVKFFFLKNFLL